MGQPATGGSAEVAGWAEPDGPLTALALVLIIGKADRFQCGKQIASYLGLVPLQDSSGNRRRLGHITKQGNALLRFLLVEAAQVTARNGYRARPDELRSSGPSLRDAT
jgi:transposase